MPGCAAADYLEAMQQQLQGSDSRGSRMVAIVAIAVIVATISMRGAPGPQMESLARLKAGNARFVADASEALPISAPRRTALAQGQTPFASVLSCADSRVPPEVIFHTGLGDLFVVRAAGHVADKSVLASLEYGVEHLHTPVLLVMGHEMCGAVKAAAETPASTSLGPNLDYLLEAIRPAVARAASQPASQRLRVAILENVEETINTLMESSSVLREYSESKRLMIVGGYYELASGQVHFSEPVRVPPRTSRSSLPGHTASPVHGPRAPAAAAAASAASPMAPRQSETRSSAPAAAAAVPAPAKPMPPAGVAKTAPAETAPHAAATTERSGNASKPAMPIAAAPPAARPSAAGATPVAAAVRPAGGTATGQTAKPAAAGH